MRQGVPHKRCAADSHQHSRQNQESGIQGEVNANPEVGLQHHIHVHRCICLKKLQLQQATHNLLVLMSVLAADTGVVQCMQSKMGLYCRACAHVLPANTYA